MQLMDRAYN